VCRTIHIDWPQPPEEQETEPEFNEEGEEVEE
jgi:hypothetical protein